MSRPLRIFLFTLALLQLTVTCFTAPLANPFETSHVIRPNISITAPAGNESWPAMTVHTIRWTYSGQISSDILDLHLLRDGNPVSSVTNTIKLGTGGRGSYAYLLPSPLSPGDNYQILLVPKGQSPATAMLKGISKPFTITQQPSIEVLDPNSSTIWQSGSTQIIRWKYIGQPGPMVTIKLLKDGPDHVIATVPIGTAGAGSYSWKIPSAIHGKYQLAVISTESSHVFQHISPHFVIKSLILINGKPGPSKPGITTPGAINQLDPQPEPPIS